MRERGQKAECECGIKLQAGAAVAEQDDRERGRDGAEPSSWRTGDPQRVKLCCGFLVAAWAALFAVSSLGSGASTLSDTLLYFHWLLHRPATSCFDERL